MNKWRNNHSMDNFLLDYQLLPFVMSPTTATTPNTNLFIPSLFGGSPACPFMLTAAATAVTATATSVPPQHRKLFIGGLNHETTDEQLRDYYSRWGHVVDCIVIRDPVTRDSRGFGFVTFSMPEMADAAMADKPHTMGGKIVDPKRAIPREQMQNVSTPPAFLDVEPPSECKIILSGIHWDFHTVDALRDYFVRFGEVEQVEIMGHPRGYGFVVFEGRSSVDKCLALSSSHIINGRKIEARGSENSDVHPPFSSLLPIMGRGSRNDHHQYPHNYNKYHSPEHGGYRKQQQHHGGYRGIGTHYGSGGSLGSQGSQSHSPAESMQSDPRESSSPQPESKTGISTPGSKSHDTPSPSSLTFQMSPNC